MNTGWLITCLIFARAFFAHEGGDFAYNHLQFVTRHLPNLLNNESGKILLLGTSDSIYPKICKQFPSIEFHEISIWNKNTWNMTIDKQNWNGRFDCVIAMNILERESNREQLIQMIFDLLKPNGRALVYVDPQDENAFDQRVEHYIRHSRWNEIIPITPSISLAEHQKLFENNGFHILAQSPDEYKIYFSFCNCDFGLFWFVMHFVCPRWPVPRTEWDEEMFAGEIKGLLNRKPQTGTFSDACIFNSLIEDALPTYYFIIKKQFSIDTI